MSVATVTDLATRQHSTPPAPSAPTPGHTLPPGAVPVDCVTFGQVVRAIERVKARMDDLERRLDVLDARRKENER